MVMAVFLKEMLSLFIIIHQYRDDLQLALLYLAIDNTRASHLTVGLTFTCQKTEVNDYATSMEMICSWQDFPSDAGLIFTCQKTEVKDHLTSIRMTCSWYNDP